MDQTVSRTMCAWGADLNRETNPSCRSGTLERQFTGMPGVFVETPAFIGNIVGGVALVAFINHAQIVSGKESKGIGQ
jgi:hypothetical protein